MSDSPIGDTSADSTTDTDSARAEAVDRGPLLRAPRDGVPAPLVGAADLDALVHALRAGAGSVAVDAERASGYRYSQRAYLVQVRRAGAGTALIDPLPLPDLSAVDDALADAEWILHAANQDLPCLAELGMRPRRLFDTELAGRLLGAERVALGTMVEQYLGVRLEKGHSAADWSTRPLPYDWLVYAALDVELLIDLRDVLAAELDAAGKTQWAVQEFEAVRTAAPPAVRAEPWRRISGIHRLGSRRQLALARELWVARDRYAAARDVAPGRVLPDTAIIDAAKANPARPADLLALPVFGGPRQRRQVDRWFTAVSAARALPDAQLPYTVAANTGDGADAIPPSARWRDRDPEAARRLTAARALVSELAEQHTVLAQNLLASDVVRRLCWSPPHGADGADGADGDVPDEESVRARLAELGARPWQIDLTAPGLSTALAG